jgi:hypothetical protein
MIFYFNWTSLLDLEIKINLGLLPPGRLIKSFNRMLHCNIKNTRLQQKKSMFAISKDMYCDVDVKRVKFPLQYQSSVSCNIHSNSCNIETRLLQHQNHSGAI